jgi:hypothetical protein
MNSNILCSSFMCFIFNLLSDAKSFVIMCFWYLLACSNRGRYNVKSTRTKKLHVIKHRMTVSLGSWLISLNITNSFEQDPF